MTIEVELGAEELRALTQPVAQVHARVPVRRSASDSNAGGSLDQGARVGLLLCASAAAVFLAVGSARVAKQHAPAAAPVVARGGGAIERRAAASPVTAPPVRFRNPFDKSEVFEFPAGTTRAEARAAVAQLLRQRARERLALLAEKPSHRRHPHATVIAQNSARLSEGGGALCTLMKCVRSDAGRL